MLQVTTQEIGAGVHPPALPPRPPPRPLRPLCGIGSGPHDCICPLQVDTAPPGGSTSPPTPAHYEPPPDHPPCSTPAHHQTGPAVSSGAHQTTNPTIQGCPRQTQCWNSALRKYVILCTACGGMAALLGALFLLVHFVLRAHTSSLHYFETVPTYVPAAMLTVTGLVVMCFARRRNRYGYLIKVCGVCCLLCAVLCVIVTVTTTVIHMNRLQTLRECVYAQKSQACTCYSGLAQDQPSAPGQDDGLRFVFHNTPDCEVVHGALYSCLRALFGLSVIGILVCIFSCMLVYQLLSHEKKKMYWEQLEMRCRYLYGRRTPQYTYCGCSCDECPRFPPSTTTTPHADLMPWPHWDQQGYLDDRYWSPPRLGNLYTPNPEEQTANQSNPQAGSTARWSWLPWNRNGGGANSSTGAVVGTCVSRGPDIPIEGAVTQRSDSQYGFGAVVRPGQPLPRPGSQVTPVCRPIASHAFVTESSGSMNRYMWGPPPPYSQPPSTSNSSTASPARQVDMNPQGRTMDVCYPARHLHHHHHHHHITPCESAASSHHASPQHRPASPQQHENQQHRQVVANSPCCARIRPDEVQGLKSLAEVPPCVGGGNNTLPSRKPKKRPSESPVNPPVAAKISTSNQQQAEGCESPGRKGPSLASSLRGLFGGPVASTARSLPQSAPTSVTNSPHKVLAPSISPLRRLPPTPCMLMTSRPPEVSESEVYFADVSSCNGGPDSSLYDEPNAPSEARGDAECAQYISIPSPLPGTRLRARPRYGERLAPDAQYEPRSLEGQQQAPQEDDAPMRDSDATIDSGVHSGSEVTLGRTRPQLNTSRVQDDQQMMPPRSVNV